MSGYIASIMSEPGDIGTRDAMSATISQRAMSGIDPRVHGADPTAGRGDADYGGRGVRARSAQVSDYIVPVGRLRAVVRPADHA